MHLIAWYPGKARWPLLAPGLLFGLALACCFPGQDAGVSKDHADQAMSFEEATPDCDVPEPQPFPERHRQQLLEQMGVQRWHQAGFRGQGIKIAVLDSGFRGYRAHLAHALPARVMVHSFRKNGNLEAKNSQHGILCSEVLHALAPESELLLANWDTEQPDRFLEAARWARRQGARVISCSVIMPSWSDGDGGGPFHESLTQILGDGTHPGDMLCFASAGNTAQRHWSGAFHDQGNGFHAWQTGQTRNGLIPWGSESVSVELYAHPGTQYELSVIDERSGSLVGRARSGKPGGAGAAVVHFLPDAAADYSVQVRLVHGLGGLFHLAALGGNLSVATAHGSVSCPADGAEVIAVGAINNDCHRAGYSSCGPNSRQPKPDFVAAVPFPSLWRKRPFTGTSAAAPQAAGLAALYWSRHPSWTAQQVRAALRSAARDLGPPGHDWETGYGLIRLPDEEAAPPMQAVKLSPPR